MSDEAAPSPSRKKWMVLCILVIAAISAAGWSRLRVDSSLEPLLPENSQATQTVLFFRDSSFADKAVLWFRLTGNGSMSDLFAAADATEKRLDPRLISRVIRPPNQSNALDEALNLLNRAGELLNEKDLSDLESAATPDSLRKRMRECYMDLVKPQGSFLQQIIRRDPLGISSRILSRLSALTSGLGYRVEVSDGQFVNPDGRQLILILETSTTATSLASSEALVAHLRALCAAAPPGIEITPICAQIHTAENDTLMRRDIQRAGAISSIAFLLLFLGVSRDWRVAAVFLLPIVTTALAIGLCALVDPNLSTMMIGLTVAMAGSAVDYGIFVYTAVRMGTAAGDVLRRIRRPLLISHLTTLGVFVAFFFSKIPAYRQLGFLTSVSLVLSLLGALFVLPRLLRPGGKIVALGSGMSLPRWGGKMVPATIIAVVLLLASLFPAARIKFDADITRLDGVSPSVRQDEDDFQKNWGRTDADQALLVVTAATRQAAEQANDNIYRIVSPHFPDGQFVSLSSFWPSAATRRANEARWRQFWSQGRIITLRRNLAAAAGPFGFSASAFDPFFQNLSSTPRQNQSLQILSSIQDPFVARSNGNWQMLSYFPDTSANRDTVQTMLDDRPDAQIVSRGALGQAFQKAAISETRLLAAISGTFIVISLLALTRSAAKSLIIMLPVLTGLIAMLAVLQMMSLSMSIVTVVAAIIVLALTSDYGVFAAYACEGNETILGQGMASVHLSFLTTLTGTGALIFARHPALFLVGVSLTCGLLAGYLTAFFVIPAIYYLWDSRKTPEAI